MTLNVSKNQLFLKLTVSINKYILKVEKYSHLFVNRLSNLDGMHMTPTHGFSFCCY